MDSKLAAELEKLLDDAEFLIHEFDRRLAGYKASPSSTWGWKSTDWLRDYASFRDRIKAAIRPKNVVVQ